MAGAVSGRTGPRCLVTAEVLALTPERALINAPVFESREGHAIVFELYDDPCGCPAHVFNGILITQVITALYRIVHMPMPVVRQHVTKCRINAALRGDCVRACRKDFGNHRHMCLGLRQLQCSPQPGATRTDHQTIEATSRNAHGNHLPKRIWTDHSASISKAVAVPS